MELSIATEDIRASLDFYSRLGFSQAAVGETWAHPYAVLTDGRLCIGLHAATIPLTLTFVKPDLLRHLPDIEAAGVEFEFRRLGNDVFNEVGWADPSGHAVRMVEARTFSPSKRSDSEQSLGGYFSEIGLPTADLEGAKTYWERLGFVGMDELDAPLPHIACTSDTIGIGLYEPAYLREPTLLFDTPNVPEAVARLGELGLSPSGPLPRSLQKAQAALFKAPEGTWILLSSALDG